MRRVGNAIGRAALVVAAGIGLVLLAAAGSATAAPASAPTSTTVADCQILSDQQYINPVTNRMAFHYTATDEGQTTAQVCMNAFNAAADGSGLTNPLPVGYEAYGYKWGSCTAYSYDPSSCVPTQIAPPPVTTSFPCPEGAYCVQPGEEITSLDIQGLEYDLAATGVATTTNYSVEADGFAIAPSWITVDREVTKDPAPHCGCSGSAPLDIEELVTHTQLTLTVTANATPGTCGTVAFYQQWITTLGSKVSALPAIPYKTIVGTSIEVCVMPSTTPTPPTSGNGGSGGPVS